MMRSTMSYFYWSFGLLFASIPIAYTIGLYGSGPGPIATTVTVLLLAVLEVSLSFDNAVVNASILKDMDTVWQKRFLTWGMLIAVFGMRLVFPIAIVSVVAGIDPIAAVALAIFNPESYETVMVSSEAALSAFGGAFLLMTALKYFTDGEKSHWIQWIEHRLTGFENNEFPIAIALLTIVSLFVHESEQFTFLLSGAFGLMTFAAVEYIGELVGEPSLTCTAAKGGLSSFIYLEMIDASFSFDGVIGAFVLTNNMLVIAIGLGIGAMFVRSLTILLVDKGTLVEYKYLEHGAFYAIAVLAGIMMIKPIVETPEVITGLLGVSFIGAALVSSIRRKTEA